MRVVNGKDGWKNKKIKNKRKEREEEKPYERRAREAGYRGRKFESITEARRGYAEEEVERVEMQEV